MFIPRIKPITRKRLYQLKRDYGDPAYREWRERVLKRDDFTCQYPKCGSKLKLQIHHIKRFNDRKDLKLSDSNGITLCNKCHRKIYSREQMYEAMFLQIVLSNKNKKQQSE